MLSGIVCAQIDQIRLRAVCRIGDEPGCQIFLYAIYQNRKKYEMISKFTK
jgi:hypothetical protein